MTLANYIDKYKNKIINLVIIIIALIVANKIYQGQTKTIESLKAQKDVAIKKNEVLASIAKLEPEIDSYKNMLGKKDRALLINNINNLAKESEVKIISIKPEPERSHPVYIRYPFSLVISARDYHYIGKFMSRLESSPDIYIVDSLNIKPSSERREIGQPEEITADLILSTIFLRIDFLKDAQSQE